MKDTLPRISHLESTSINLIPINHCPLWPRGEKNPTSATATFGQ